MSDEFPVFWQIDALAQMCVEFVPWLQHRQWILETDTNVQSQLIRLRLRMSRLSTRVLENVICKNNMEAFQLLLPILTVSEWFFLVQNATKEMLHFALQNGRFSPYFEGGLSKAPFENFKLFCATQNISPQFGQMLIADIFMGLLQSPLSERDLQCLDWMLNEMKLHARIPLTTLWNDHLTAQTWAIIKPSILDRRSIFYDENMLPVEHNELFPLCKKRQEQIYYYFVKTGNFAKAASLWIQSFTFNNCFQISITQRWKGYSYSQKDHFEWQRQQFRDTPPGIMACEKALACNGSETFYSALHKYLESYICSFASKDLIIIFKQCFFFGLPCIARIVWSVSQTTHMLEILQDGSASCNEQMLEFAYEKLSGATMERIKDTWRSNSIQTNNIVLWKFLLDKRMITQQSCFDLELMRNHVDFVRFAWSEIQETCIRQHTTVLCSALKSKNGPLLSFLSQQSEFKLDNDVLLAHLATLSEIGLVNLIEKTNRSPACDVLGESYIVAQDLQTLCALYHRFGVVVFTNLQIDTLCKHHMQANNFMDRFFLFFLRNHFCTLKQVFDTMPDGTQKDDLLGYLYCDF